MRGAARRAAFSALQQELERRFAALPSATIFEQVEKTFERVARNKGRAAFLGAGGTLAGFEHIWSALWPRALKDALTAARNAGEIESGAI